MRKGQKKLQFLAAVAATAWGESVLESKCAHAKNAAVFFFFTVSLHLKFTHFHAMVILGAMSGFSDFTNLVSTE